MKKYIPILIITSFLLSACSINENIRTKDDNEVSINLKNITYSKISADARLLKCIWLYDSSLAVFEEEWKSSGTISDNSESFEMTILDNDITMFWANFSILENSDNVLIWMRKYDNSWLTEVLHLNKNNWILFDSKTYTQWLWNAPAWFDTVFSCKS